VTIKIKCPACDLQAEHHPSVGGIATTTFDASAFRDTCKAAHASKSFECPNLTKLIEAVGHGAMLDA
jgi:hypothetical protein